MAPVIFSDIVLLLLFYHLGWAMSWLIPLFLLLAQLAWGTPEDTNIVIPLKFRNTASGGLVYQGAKITPEEAVNLHLQGTPLSQLEPGEETDLWRNEVAQTSDPREDALPLDPNLEVEFLNTSMEVPGTIEFTVRQNDSRGGAHLYVVRVSRKIQNVLLRKALLRKIGYIIPPSQHLPKLKVRFTANDSHKRNQFLKQVIWKNLAANPARWVGNFYGIKKVAVENVHGELVEREQYLFLPPGVDRHHPHAEQWAQLNPQEMVLEFQDVLVYPIANHSVLDLSLGFLPSSVNQNLRLLNAVVLAYALTDVPESVNKFSWHIGRIKDHHLVLPYEEYPQYAQQYRPNYEDVLWIMGRIAQLKREDFKHIVQGTHYPSEIAAVVCEKLLARRNHLVKVLDLPFSPLAHKESSDLNSEHVHNGVVTQDFWPGYGARFAHNEVDSPLSHTEVFAFFKSKTLSNLFGNLTRKANKKLQAVSLSSEWQQRQREQVQKNFFKFLQTGEPQKRL